ncbi:MAG: metal ABC transporter permease [Oligosphaeraceae bacterium]|nr:metal ABC transporter permease [Oligosphaeraceae bacterium]
MLAFFLRDLQSPGSLLRLSIIAILLCSIVCGIIGSYVVAKRCSYVVGAVSHSLLGGIGLARFCQLQKGWAWFSPMLGAILVALLVAAVISFLTLRKRQREDSVLSAIWAMGMATGLSFIYATPGHPQDLQGYLFGNILLVSRQDLLWMAVLNIIILIFVSLFHKRFLCLCFSEEWLRLRGCHVGLFNFLLYALISLTVVMLSQLVGVLLCLALLILPAASAANFCRSLPPIMFCGILISLGASMSGLLLSYQYDLPAGATIVELIAVTYLLCIAGRFLHGKIRPTIQKGD